MRPFIFAAVLSCSASSGVMACGPVAPEFWEDSPKRVKSNFDNAEFVVVALVSNVRNVSVSDKTFPRFTSVVERARFRVERSFKGKLKPGDTFTIESGKTACGRGVMSAEWVPLTSGEELPRAEYPKRWLIYYTSTPFMPDSPVQPPAFEISVSRQSMPVDYASYDLELLTKFAGSWARQAHRYKRTQAQPPRH